METREESDLGYQQEVEGLFGASEFFLAIEIHRRQFLDTEISATLIQQVYTYLTLLPLDRHPPGLGGMQLRS